VTSLELELDESRAMPTPEEARHTVARHFGRIFGRHILWMESLDDLVKDADLMQGEDLPKTTLG
jgi:hypothetical protein